MKIATTLVIAFLIMDIGGNNVTAVPKRITGKQEMTDLCFDTSSSGSKTYCL